MRRMRRMISAFEDSACALTFLCALIVPRLRWL